MLKPLRQFTSLTSTSNSETFPTLFQFAHRLLAVLLGTPTNHGVESTNEDQGLFQRDQLVVGHRQGMRQRGGEPLAPIKRT